MRYERKIAIAVTGGAAIGIGAELVSDASIARSAADLATGWTLLGCGLWGWRARPDQLRWPLLAGAGLAWFAGNFADVGAALIASIGGALIYLHRGLLVHATLSGARSRSPLVVVTGIAGYAAALITDSANAGLTVVAGVLVGALGVDSVVRSGARAVRPAPLVGAARLVLGAGLVLAGATALADTSPGIASAALYGYEAALVAAALLLVAVPVYEGRARALVADLVVELGPARRSPTVRDALARALGDPSLELGYWLPAQGRYVDSAGRTVELPAPVSRRTATILERDAERIAVLVHDATVLGDPALTRAVEEAAGLVVANARLEAEVAAQLAELRASRQRIVEARDEQKRRLARRLHEGAERRLADVAEAVSRSREQASLSEQDAELFDMIDEELAQAREELANLARGIHPRALTERGLSAALAALAERAPVRVELSAPVERLPAPVEAAAYFVSSEALANVAKYARASRVRCEVTRANGHLRVAVVDDGVGGADPRRGSGLRGLFDRVEALGGSLEVTSLPGQGTIVRAELPLPGDDATIETRTPDLKGMR
jgi:signal transduction histidine kinase